MHFSKITGSRSICINGDWDNRIFEITINEGESKSKAEDLLSSAIDQWENEMREKRNSSVNYFTTEKVIQVEKFTDKLKETLQAINKSESLEELKQYWYPAKTNLILSEAYKTRTAILTNKEKQ